MNHLLFNVLEMVVGFILGAFWGASYAFRAVRDKRVEVQPGEPLMVRDTTGERGSIRLKVREDA